jgi:hypothetical protein
MYAYNTILIFLKYVINNVIPKTIVSCFYRIDTMKIQYKYEKSRVNTGHKIKMMKN